MAIVAGVDFGTLSVRVSLVDSDRGLIESATAEYPLHRKREDPEYATQSHQDHMQSLALATRDVLKKSGVRGDQVLAIALDTTGSSVIPVGENSLSVSTTSGATIAPKERRLKSQRLPTAKSCKRLNGAGESIPPNGASPNFCTGFATTRTSALSLSQPLSIAIW